jgi:hypothetical protein
VKRLLDEAATGLSTDDDNGDDDDDIGSSVLRSATWLATEQPTS